jgi:hypothetical protein
MKFAERRRFPRYGFQADVEINMEGKRYRSFLTDVSVGGVFIVARNPLWVGAEFELRILLSEPIGARCQVRRVALGQGMGAMFLELSRESRERLDALLKMLAI